MVLMIFDTWRLESWMPAIEVTMSLRARFDSFVQASTCPRWPTTSFVASAFFRVINANCSTDAEVSSSDAACSVALCDRLCERSEEHTSELQSRVDIVCRLLLEKKKI